MSELDEAWATALSEAEQKARLAGRGDVAEYLSLKNSNDLLRNAGVQWLIESFTTAAGDANRAGASIQIAKSDGHRFKVGTSTMVGQLVTLTFGVRMLFVEAGWPRVPRDGIVRGGGLACANIHHRGIRAASEELLLAKTISGTPNWKSLTKERSHLQQSDIHLHISILLDRPGSP
ncbi:MAG TPA: hypothetical protein VFZ22_16340 [Pyrinomonadaceae bacterium]|nr:hypothetical protein [Pyrinomonadaceae bacterium]